MRLTLRTLLAYLDDRLSPANAKELGQKLTASPFATELADRIRNVMRRRRLAKEPVGEKTIDANLVAEYLDDQLTPELVALIEKEILTSDQSLAEVAATHQILGLLSDPVEIHESLKERFYALAPSTNQETAEGDAPGTATSTSQAGTGWQPLQPPAETQKRSPMILLAVMVLGWLVLLATDSNLFGTGKRDSAETDGAAVVVADNDLKETGKEAEKALTEAGTSSETRTPANEPNGKSTDVVDADSKPATAGTEPKTAAENTDTNTLPKTSSEASARSDTAVAQKPGDPEMKEATVEPNENVADTVQKLELIDDQKVVAIQSADQEEWVWAARGAAPARPWATEMMERLVMVAQPYTARLMAPDAGWGAEFVGPAVFGIADAKSAMLHLVEGRMLLRRYVNDKATVAQIFAGRRILDVSIPAQGHVVAVEVIPMLPTEAGNTDAARQADLFPLNNTALIRISSADADVQLRIVGSDQAVQIRQGSEWTWDTGSDISTDGSVTLQPMLSEWVFAAQKPPTGLEADVMAETSLVYQNSTTVLDAAMKLTENLNPEIAAFGVRHLGQLRNVEALVQLLLQSDLEVTRHEAVAWLHRIIHQQPQSQPRILASLETHLPSSELNDAMDLIIGVTPTAAEQRRDSDRLVNALSSNRASMRDLAIFNLMRLMNGERYGFFADDDLARRQAAIKRWKRLLDRNDGRLIKPPE